MFAGDREYAAGIGSWETFAGIEGGAKMGTGGVYVYGSANGIAGGCKGG
jgi:hypothetical protein